MVRALNDVLLRMGITRSHFLPIQHLIAGGDHGQQALGVCALSGCIKPLQPRTHIQGLQLINENRALADCGLERKPCRYKTCVGKVILS